MFQSLFFWNGLWDTSFFIGLKVPLTCFNPCFSGMAFGTHGKRIVWLSGQSCFNPCFSGMAFGTRASRQPSTATDPVSILVFLEWPLGHGSNSLGRVRDYLRFNPCFSGMAFGTVVIEADTGGITGFNPCFSGMAFGTLAKALRVKVDILSFNPCFSGMAFGTRPRRHTEYKGPHSFNPCFSGMAFGTKIPGL